MSANNKTYTKEEVSITGSAYQCVFNDCPKVEVLGFTRECVFNNCQKITLMGSCHDTTVLKTNDITIMGSANTVSFEQCVKITVLGSTTNCTRDGIPFTPDTFSQNEGGNVVQRGGGGVNIIQNSRVGGNHINSVISFGGRVTMSGNSKISMGGGVLEINGVRYEGAGSMVNNVWVPQSHGFTDVMSKNDGLVYGKTPDGTWYFYNSLLGPSSRKDAWEKIKLNYDQQPHYLLATHGGATAPRPEPGTELYSCIHCKIETVGTQCSACLKPMCKTCFEDKHKCNK